MSDKRIEDYAHLDIDQMSGKQLAEYSIAVANSAIDILSIVSSHSMPYHDLVKMLQTGAQGPSEVAYGLMYGVLYGMIEQVHVGSVRTIRLKENNEQQPEG